MQHGKVIAAICQSASKFQDSYPEIDRKTEFLSGGAACCERSKR